MICPLKEEVREELIYLQEWRHKRYLISKGKITESGIMRFHMHKVPPSEGPIPGTLIVFIVPQKTGAAHRASRSQG